MKGTNATKRKRIQRRTAVGRKEGRKDATTALALLGGSWFKE